MPATYVMTNVFRSFRRILASPPHMTLADSLRRFLEDSAPFTPSSRDEKSSLVAANPTGRKPKGYKANPACSRRCSQKWVQPTASVGVRMSFDGPSGDSVPGRTDVAHVPRYGVKIRWTGRCGLVLGSGRMLGDPWQGSGSRGGASCIIAFRRAVSGVGKRRRSQADSPLMWLCGCIQITIGSAAPASLQPNDLVPRTAATAAMRRQWYINFACTCRRPQLSLHLSTPLPALLPHAFPSLPRTATCMVHHRCDPLSTWALA